MRSEFIVGEGRGCSASMKLQRRYSLLGSVLRGPALFLVEDAIPGTENYVCDGLVR